MLDGQKIALVIPALNEARSIGRVLAEVPGFIDDVIVVDNGSTDGTGEAARAHGARVVHEPCAGYGAACMAGISACPSADLVAFIDADYSDYPVDLASVIRPVAGGRFELAVGRRIPREARAIPWHQRLGNWLACRAINLLHGSCFRDLGPMRCIRKSALDALHMQDRSYGWTSEMQIRAARRLFRIAEVPVRYRRRIGDSKISGTLKGSMLAATRILYWTFRLAVAGERAADARQG